MATQHHNQQPSQAHNLNISQQQLQNHYTLKRQPQQHPQQTHHPHHHEANPATPSTNCPKMESVETQFDKNDEVMQQLMILVRETQETDQIVQQNNEIYQNYVIQLQTRDNCRNGIRYCEEAHYQAVPYDVADLKAKLATLQNSLNQRANELNHIRNQLVSKQYDIFERLEVIQNKILSYYLPRWHLEQQLMNNGVQLESVNLDTMQSWVEKIVDIIWRIKNQIKGLQLTLTGKPNVPFNTEELEQFVVYINKALEQLILNSFVVEKQPPQVMKTNTRFMATVRFLCGNKLNVQMINPTVKALILSEQNARAVIKYHKSLIESSWSGVGGRWSESLVDSSSAHGTPAPATSQHIGANSQTSVIAQAMMLTHQAGQLMDPQRLGYSASGPMQNLNDSSMIATNLSPDQAMLVSEQAPPQQQHYLHQQHPPNQPQHFNQVPHATQQHQRSTNMQLSGLANMTSGHHYGGITEIGYNPDVPASKEFECSGEILNNSNILQYQETTGQMTSQFKNMQLKKIKRTEKRGTESVMDEKFVLLFFTEFRIADDSFSVSMAGDPDCRLRRGDLLFHILAFSLPVVVIVHGNQEPHAWATVTWHNAFAKPDQVLYTVPDRVAWRDLGEVLSEKFRSHAGRGLSQHNLRYLAHKVYRSRVDNDDIQVTWNQFAKEQLSDKSFTFWEWFHSILKLTKDHLSPLWKAERIYGFVGKRGCVDLLLGSAYADPCPVGTFLLRFSETELGGVTIAWVANSSELSTLNVSLNDRVQISQRSSPTNSSTTVVMHLQPFVAKDLSTRSLADRIRDLKDLVYLHPNIPKDDAFEAYYTPINAVASKCNEGYIKSLLVTTLAKNYPGTSNQHTEVSVTPSSMSQNSPEEFFQDNMTDAMDSNYSNYDQSMNDFNYTIQ